MTKQLSLITPERLESVRLNFWREGITFTSWAAEHNFSPALVYAVLGGRSNGRRGKSYAIALALGLLPSPPTPNGTTLQTLPGSDPNDSP